MQPAEVWRLGKGISDLPNKLVNAGAAYRLCKSRQMQELDEAAAAQVQPAEVRRLPKGTSAYQAAWILDEVEVDAEDEGEELQDVVVRLSCPCNDV